jgi:transposase InsO family protein
VHCEAESCVRSSRGLSWFSAGGRPEGDGWVGMKRVALLWRVAGVGAPRNADSLYRNIERVPRRFNPLKIPRALQVSRPAECS